MPWSNKVSCGSKLVLMVITMRSKQFRVEKDEVSARNPIFSALWSPICTRPVLQAPDGPCLGPHRARARRS